MSQKAFWSSNVSLHTGHCFICRSPCPQKAHSGLPKQTQNVGKVVGPNRVSLYSLPTIVVCDRADNSIVTRHDYPNRGIPANYIPLTVFTYKSRKSGPVRQA